MQKKDLRTLVERTNYYKRNYISNTQLGRFNINKDNWVILWFCLLMPIFLFFIYQETKDVSLMFQVPLLYIWIVIYIIWIIILMKGKTTLKWVRRIYEILWDYIAIYVDRSSHTYNKKQYFCNNELKKAKINI